MKKTNVNTLVLGAFIAALYAALTYAASLAGLAYGQVQFRFSEALTVLAALTPAAIPGLTIGCFLGNLGSPYGMVDIICGTLATLIAAVLSYLTRNVKIKGIPVLAPLFPVISNSVIVGLEIAFFLPEGISLYGFLINALSVCFGAGIPLLIAVEKTGLKKYFKFK